jgi:hypothetical protein
MLHPVDLALEFLWPTVVAAGSYLVFQDSFVLLVTVAVFSLWYALDHDEWLALTHSRHHAHIDSVLPTWCLKTTHRGLTR